MAQVSTLEAVPFWKVWCCRGPSTAIWREQNLDRCELAGGPPKVLPLPPSSPVRTTAIPLAVSALIDNDSGRASFQPGVVISTLEISRCRRSDLVHLDYTSILEYFSEDTTTLHTIPKILARETLSFFSVATRETQNNPFTRSDSSPKQQNPAGVMCSFICVSDGDKGWSDKA